MRIAVRVREVVVPPLFKIDREQARRRLQDIELRMTTVGEVYHADVPTGAVVSQLPTGGERIKANSQVQVIVSLGAQRRPVPDLIGSTQRVAQLVLQQAGYEIGDISEIFLPNLDSDQIIQQIPSPGSQEVMTTRVNILVGRKLVQTYIMPDLSGLNLNRARALIRTNFFVAPQIQYSKYFGMTRGDVVRQYPEPGYMLKKGDTIHLEVAR